MKGALLRGPKTNDRAGILVGCRLFNEMTAKKAYFS